MSSRSPTQLRTTDLPSSCDTPLSASPMSDSSSSPLTPRYAPIRSTTAPTLPACATTPASPAPSSNYSHSSSPSSTRSSTDDSLWSVSLSRYSFCSSNAQRTGSEQSSRSSSRARTPKRPKDKRQKRPSGTTMQCGRHGDEWLFGGWANIVKGFWK